MPYSSPDQSTPPAAELLRARGQSLVSRRLHDDVGPTLCAVGLHIGILKSSLRDAPAALESIATIESALSEAIRMVRGLSYRTDPGIVRRCGLRSALEYLCQDAAVRFDDTQALLPLAPDQAEALFRLASELVLDAADFAPDLPLSLRTRPDGFALEFAPPPATASRNTTAPRRPPAAPGRSFPSEATLEAFDLLFASGFICWEHRRQSGELVVSASTRNARV